MADSTAAARAAGETSRTTDDELEHIRHQLADETAKRQAAEQERDAERARLAGERTNRFQAQEQAIASATDANKSKLADAKRRYAQTLRKAQAAADEGEAERAYEEAANIQEEISHASIELKSLAWQQGRIEELKKAPPVADHRTRFEQALSTLPQEAQAWCRQHPDYVTDTRKNALAQGAHFKALGEGIAAWSPEYWTFVESELGLADDGTSGNGTRRPGARAEVTTGGDDGFEVELPEGGDDGFEEIDLDTEEPAHRRQERQPAATPQAQREGNPIRRAAPTRETPPRNQETEPRRPTSTAAPPSRGAPNGTGGSTPRGRRQLTQGEVEAAKISFPDEWREDPKKAIALYAQNMTALKREGRLN